MDFGDHGLLAHPLPENITPKMFDRYNNGLHWSIVNMSSSDSLLLFNTNSFELFIMDKEKRLCEGYKEAYNDLSRIHCGRIIPTQGLPEGIVFQCNAHSIEETLQAWAKKNDMPLVLKEISRNFNPEGNPLIMSLDHQVNLPLHHIQHHKNNQMKHNIFLYAVILLACLHAARNKK